VDSTDFSGDGEMFRAAKRPSGVEPTSEERMLNDHPLTLTVEQAAEVLGIARSTAYELVRSGDLGSIRLRRRLVVPVAPLADRLGVSATEVWGVLEGSPSSAAESKPLSTRTGERRLGVKAAPTLF